MKTLYSAFTAAAAVLMLSACGDSTPVDEMEPAPDEAAPVAVDVPEIPGRPILIPEDQLDAEPEPEQVEESLPEDMTDEPATE